MAKAIFPEEEKKKKNKATLWAETTEDGIARRKRIYGDVRVADDDYERRVIHSAGFREPALGRSEDMTMLVAKRQPSYGTLSRARSFEEYMKLRRDEEEAQGMQRAAERLLEDKEPLYNEESQGFLDKYFDGRLPMGDEFATRYEQLLNNPDVPDAEVKHFFENGADLVEQAKADLNRTKEERTKAAEESRQLWESQFGYKRMGDQAVYATPFSPLPRPTEENTLTKAQAPAAFGIGLDEYMQSMRGLEEHKAAGMPALDEESAAFIDRYFGGKVPTQQEYDEAYERLYNDFSVSDEEVRRFFEEGPDLVGRAMEYEQLSLLGQDAENQTGRSDAEYVADYYNDKLYGSTLQEAKVPFAGLEGPLAMSQEEYERLYANPMIRRTQQEQMDILRWGEMTQDEKDTYMQIMTLHGEEAAKKYLGAMESVLNERQMDEETAQASEFAQDHPFWASLLAPAERVVGGANYAMIRAGEILSGKDADVNDLRRTSTRVADTMVGTVSQNIEEDVGGFGGKALGFGYQTLMSLADMGANLLAYGPAGPLATATGMSLGAASSTYNSVIDAGADHDTANAMAAVAGAAEAVFEKISIENLIGMARGGSLKGAVLNVLRQIGVEASEEAATEVANQIGEYVLMGDLSTYEQEGAAGAARDIGLAALGGALMGGVSGGVQQAALGLKEWDAQRELKKAAEELANAEQQAAEPAEAEPEPTPEKAEAPAAMQSAENAPENVQDEPEEAENAQAEEVEAEEEKPAEARKTGKNTEAFQTAKEARVSADGEEHAVRVLGVASVNQDGRITLEVETESGEIERVNAAELSYDDPVTEELMAYGASERMDAKGLRNYLEGYDQSIATAEEYADAYSSIYSRARSGMDFEQAALANPVRTALTRDAMINAFASGQNAYNRMHDTVRAAEVEEAQGEASEAAVFSARESGRRARLSKRYSNAAFESLGRDGRKRANAQMELLKAIASRTGRTIAIVDTIVGKNGQHANALYDPKTGEIRIALDAAEGAYAYAAMHELTHAIKREHAGEWAGFVDFVRGCLEKSQNWDELVNYQMEQFGYSREIAEEEVICNTVPAILQDERNLLKLYKGNRTLFERVVDWVRGLLEDVKAAGESLSARSRSWQQMDAFKGDRKTLQEIYDRMMAIAEKGTQEESRWTVEEQVTSGVNENVMEAPVDDHGDQIRYSLTTYTQELPKPMSVARAKALDADYTVKKLGDRGKRTVVASGRSITEALLVHEGHSRDVVKKTLDYMDRVAKWFEKAVGRYEYVNLQDVNDASIIIDHNTGEIKFSCKVPNSEYKVNFDFTTVCRQREAVQRFVDELAQERGKQGTKLEDISLTPQNIFKLNTILKNEGYETACLGCFAEAKRYRIKAQADTLVDEWNSLVLKKNPNAEYFGFSTGDTDLMKMSDEEIHKLEAGMRGYSTKGTSKAIDRAERLVELEEMQKLIRTSDIISRQGRQKIREFSPALESFLVSRFGQSGAKPAVGFMPYNSEIAALPDTKNVNGKRMSFRKYLEQLGGARSNSFSDYIPTHALDYLQRTVDMAARGFTAHCYTKVLARARTFGRTGEKINLSVMFDIDPQMHWAQAGLDKNGEYIVGDKRRADRVEKETGVRPFTQSIPFDEAVELEHDPDYADSVGIIGVGYSYRHIAKMMEDENIPYIIPYHRSSMPDAVARASNTRLATNYEPVQNNTRVTGYAVVQNMEEGDGTPSYATWPEGKKKTKTTDMTYDLNAAVKRSGGSARKAIAEWLGWMQENNLTPVTSTAEAGHGKFDIYASLERTMDPAKTADEYMDYCIENGLLPVFYEFAGMDGYDKTLFDFSVRNLATGETALQKPVSLDFIDKLSAETMMEMMDQDMAEYNEYNREQFGSEKWERVKEAGYQALQEDEIRYSMRDTDENVRTAFAAEGEAFRQVQAHRITAMEADKIAGKVLRIANSDYDQAKLASEISRTVDYAERGEDVDMRQVDDELTAIAARVLERSRTLDLEHEERAKPVRDYLRTTRMHLTSAQLGEAEKISGSYRAYQQTMFGRVRLGRGGIALDQAWQELSDMAPEWFPADTAEGDMPRLLMQAVDASKPVYHTGMGMTLEESANWLAGQMVQKYFALPAVEAAAKNARTFGDSVRELKKAMKTFEETSWSEYMNSLQAIKEARDQQNKTKYQQKAAALRAKYKAWREKDTAQRREREEKNRYLSRIEATTNTLLNWLEKPTDAKHVPAGVEDAVRRMLDCMSFKGKNTMAAESISARLKDLADIMQKAQNGELEERSGPVYFEQDQQMIDEIRNVAEMIRNNSEHQGLKDRSVYGLNSAELKELSKWLNVVKKILTDAGKLRGTDLVEYGSLSEVQAYSIADMRGKKAYADRKKIVKEYEDLFGLDMLDSFTFFERLGPTATRVFQGLRKGFDENTKKLREAEEFSRKIFEGLDLKKITGKNAPKEQVELSDGTVLELTHGEMMAIYVLSRREQARGHMYKEQNGEGIIVKRDGKDQDPDPKPLTFADEKTIAGKLTEDEKRVAEAMQKFLSTECAGWGNETSMKLVGYRKFGEQYYWPIRTDPNTRNTAKLEENYDANIDAILHQGMTKATVEGARNAIVIEDIFDSYTRHISNMAAYSAYAIPLSDFNKWYGNTELKRSIAKLMGPRGGEYIKNLIMAINGSARGESRTAIERRMATLNRNAKAASVGANMRVAVQQPTSYARAAAYMSPKYLSRALTQMAPDPELVYRWCGIAQWKDWGFRETNVGPNLKELLTGQKTGLAKLQDKAMVLAAKGDEWTLNRLWCACELETRDLYGYEVGSEAYYTQVGKRMSELVDRTQVVDSVFHRSQMMRSKSWLAQTLTNFMSEPTKTYNMLYNALYDYAESPRDRDGHRSKAARMRLGRIYGVWVATSVLTAGAAAIVDAFRDDEDEKEWLEKWVNAFWDNTQESLNPLGMLPGVKEVLSIVQGYSPSRMDLQGIQRIMWAIQAVERYSKGEGTQNAYGVTYKVAQAASSLTGVPVSNLMRDINSVLQAATGTSPTLSETSSEKQRQRVKLIYDAYMAGNKEKASSRRETMKKRGGVSDKKIDEMLAEFLLDDANVKAAWEAKANGRIADANKARSVLTEKGIPKEAVDKAVQKYGNSVTPKDVKEKDPDEQLNVKLYSSTDARNTVQMILNGSASREDLDAILSELAADSTAKDPEKSTRSTVQSALKEDYLELVRKGDTRRISELESIMTDVLKTPQSTLNKWRKEAKGK